ncbi:MAG: hypothetical protein K2N71_07695, partial [Oscillospiraceae bacterium]|nr:hypothetical protein [Oscillospiraceae bacterium]
LIINKNNTASAETTVIMSLDDFDFSAADELTQDERDIIMRIDTENRIAAVLSELDWINSARVNIADDDLSASAVLDVSREPSSDEADAAAHLITLYVDGLEKEDVVISDQNNNVIFSE